MILQRLKNLWALSESEPKKPTESEIKYSKLPPEKKMAQIVSLDEALDLFDKEENEI
jgi:hypothetical protein